MAGPDFISAERQAEETPPTPDVNRPEGQWTGQGAYLELTSPYGFSRLQAPEGATQNLQMADPSMAGMYQQQQPQNRLALANLHIGPRGQSANFRPMGGMALAPGGGIVGGMGLMPGVGVSDLDAYNPDPETMRQVQDLESQARRIQAADNIDGNQKGQALYKIAQQMALVDPERKYNRDSLLRGPTAAQKYKAENMIQIGPNAWVGLDGKQTPHLLQVKPEVDPRIQERRDQEKHQSELQLAQLKDSRERAKHDADERRKQEAHDSDEYDKAYTHLTRKEGSGPDAKTTPPSDEEVKNYLTSKRSHLHGIKQTTSDQDVFGAAEHKRIWQDENDVPSRERFEAAKAARDTGDMEGYQAIKTIHMLERRKQAKHGNLNPSEIDQYKKAVAVAGDYLKKPVTPAKQKDLGPEPTLTPQQESGQENKDWSALDAAGEFAGRAGNLFAKRFGQGLKRIATNEPPVEIKLPWQ